MVMISDQKAALRQNLKRIRAAVHAQSAIAAAEHVTNYGYGLVKGLGTQKIIALYYPNGDELDARFLQMKLEQAGFRTALPRVIADDKPLVFHLWGQGDPLVSGRFGIEEPAADAPTVTPDVIFCPLLGYDAKCYRIGYGGGYYDRTIAHNPAGQYFGLAYAAQVLDDLPREQHDMPLMGVVTEDGVILPQN